MSRSIAARTLIVLITATILTTPAKADTIYVDDDAPLGGDGLSWTAPYKYLQDALFEAASDPVITEIRVAGGLYKPDLDEGGNVTLGDREATFQLISGLAIYGGYAGYGAPDPDERDIVACETILSGDLNGDDGPEFANNDENSYHVVVGSATNETAVLDGLTITAGNANGPSYPYHYRTGGGMYNDSGDPTLASCTFRGNIAVGGVVLGGGGLANVNLSHPTLINCTFGENAAYYGGGMYNYEWSDPTLTNCVFVGNCATGHYGWGGGIYSEISSPTLVNCLFVGNSADSGGAIGCWTACSPDLINCTFVANSTSSGFGTALASGHFDFPPAPCYVDMDNCILWDGGNEVSQDPNDTIVIRYSDVQGGWGGTGNIDADPLFTDPNNGNYRLPPGLTLHRCRR